MSRFLGLTGVAILTVIAGAKSMHAQVSRYGLDP